MYDIPDILSLSGHAEDKRTIRDPHESSRVTRSSKQTRRLLSRDISDPHSNPPNDFLIPFQYGFHREILIGSKGKWTIYYYPPDRERIRTKKKADPFIKHLKNITIENFTFQKVKLSINDPLNKYQSIRYANQSRCSTSRTIPQGSYQSTLSNDSAQSVGENQQYRKEDQDACWDQTEDTYIKEEFDPGPYSTDVLHCDEWRSRKQISSDDTEEEAAPYETRNVTLQDSVDSKQLVEARIHNKMLPSKTNHSEIKQEPRSHPHPQ